MMIVSINQTLALPDMNDSHLVADGARGTWGGAGGGHASGGPGLLCLWANQEFSRGTLRLASPDPDVHPVIEQNLLNDPGDLTRMRDGVHRCLELIRSGAFDAAFEHIAVDLAGTGTDALTDDPAIDRWLLETIGDTGHICGTCRMGAPTTRARWSTRRAACSASKGCGWPTPRSSPRCRGPTPTCRPSPPRNGSRTS